MENSRDRPVRGFVMAASAALFLGASLAAGLVIMLSNSRGVAQSAPAAQVTPARGSRAAAVAATPGPQTRKQLKYQPRQPMDTGAFFTSLHHLRWPLEASLEGIRDNWLGVDARMITELDTALPPPGKSDTHRLLILLTKATVFNYRGETKRAYELPEDTRAWVEKGDKLAEVGLYTVIFFQAVTALRLGENDNCIMCRGESSCIIPIVPAAVHTNPTGSRLAIRHFTEYLSQFPDDLAIRWLLNLAHMTLGEHPQKVDPRYLVSIDHFVKSEFNIGKFRDIGHQAGVDRFNMAGGAVMDDFDNDGRLDLVTTSFDPAAPMGFNHNAGDGTFVDRTAAAGLTQQLGGKYLVQMDYNNDGLLDLFISRGAWFALPMPQTLLRNNGGGKFTDVTQQAGLHAPNNSTSSRWADYDNDGWLDVFILGEKLGNRLYHNRGDGTFEDVSSKAGIREPSTVFCKGADWIDYDNDDYPDLFVDDLQGNSCLYHNKRDGTFADVTASMGIDGPTKGFSCWAWDYDNDGWLDIFATCFDYTIEDVVKGLLGQPHDRLSNRLFRNMQGKRFENKTKEAGLDVAFAAMGSNFGDFDNDGFLDFYLGTGDPDLSTLVPNRMFKNVAGQRFAEITGTSGTGNLQKGHGVTCGDWDNDGDVDLFIEMGGAIPGDRYHNILFQNPGQGNNWLSVKLVGKKTNRAAIGARIKLITAGDQPLTVHRHVSTGSSWGANPLQQHLGLAKASKVALLEIHWPTSGTTQVFHDIAANQAIEVTEFEPEYRKLDRRPIPAPK
jgi:ASPIC and UnbV/FG-GAP-like repeat